MSLNVNTTTTDIKSAIIDYLSTDRSDDERTIRYMVRSLQDQFTGLKKRSLNQILYKDDEFTSKKKQDDHRVYWYITEPEVSIVLYEDTQDRTYVFVDVDNSPDMFYYLAQNASTYGTLFIRGYSGPYYNSSRAEYYIEDEFNLDTPVSFHQSKITTKDAADVALLLDLFLTLQRYPNITCFIISADHIFSTVVTELSRRFPGSDLCAGRDSDSVRRDILACI